MLILLLIPLLIGELYLSLKVVESIGAGWSVVWIIGGIFVGLTLLKSTPKRIVGNMENLSKGKLNAMSFQNANLSYLFGSILILIPGILSDIFGIIALLYTIYLQFVAKVTPENKNTYHNHKGDENVIDVEIINEYHSTHSGS
jgi:UPF0716 protein FxsA